MECTWIQNFHLMVGKYFVLSCLQRISWCPHSWCINAIFTWICVLKVNNYKFPTFIKSNYSGNVCLFPFLVCEFELCVKSIPCLHKLTTNLLIIHVGGKNCFCRQYIVQFLIKIHLRHPDASSHAIHPSASFNK